MDFEKIEGLSEKQIKELYKDVIENNNNISYCCGGVKGSEDDFGSGFHGTNDGCELNLSNYYYCNLFMFQKFGYYNTNCLTPECKCYRYNTTKTWSTCYQ